MMRNVFFTTASAAVLSVVMITHPLAGQPKSGPEVDYVPPEKQREKSQATVSEMLERLLAVMEVADKIGGKIEGKAGEASQRGVVNLFLSRTTLEAFPPLQGECERLRWSLVRTRNERTIQANRIQIDIAKAQREIDLKAEEIVKLENTTNLPTDEADAATRKANDMKTELLERLKFREELNTQAASLTSRASECDRELKQLSVLQDHLDSLVRVELIRVDRNLAAVEYQSLARTTDDVDKRRQAIAGAVQFLQARRQPNPVPSTAGVITEAKSPPFENPKDMAKEIEKSELLRKALEDARKRATRSESKTPVKK